MNDPKLSGIVYSVSFNSKGMRCRTMHGREESESSEVT